MYCIKSIIVYNISIKQRQKVKKIGDRKMKKFVITTATADPRIENNHTSNIYDEESINGSDYKDLVKDLILDGTVIFASYHEKFDADNEKFTMVRWTTTITRIA